MYLYGAAINGIQKYIFQTNRLREIIGASSLIELFSTKLFEELIDSIDKKNVLREAGGKITIQSPEKENIEKLVRDLPRKVAELMPGVSFSQAVVRTVKSDVEKEDFARLEKALAAQRNRGPRLQPVSGCGIERSRRTGESAHKYMTIKKKDEIVDHSTYKKITSSKENENANNLCRKITGTKIPFLEIEGEKYNFAMDIEDISGTDSKSWVAVIHADGNGLGKILQQLDGGSDTFKEFSNSISESTTKAVTAAFHSLFEKKLRMEDFTRKKIPFRPVIIGGDDITVICRADIALDFTIKFLEEFEKETHSRFGEGKGLSACAGIAFVKDSYPFYYAAELAEELCARSKKVSKAGLNETDFIPSSLLFHKVQSSFVDSFDQILRRELTANDVSLLYGPYGIAENSPLEHNVSELLRLVDKLRESKKKEGALSPASLRKWLSELHVDANKADQLTNRIKQLHAAEIKDLGLEPHLNPEQKNESEGKKTIIYDVLSLLSLEGV